MVTFGIITKVFGNEETRGFLRKLIDSIHLQNIPEYQIIVVGDYKEDGVETIDFPEDLNGTSYITRKQNLIIDNAKYENIVFLRDYNILWKYWFDGLQKFGYDWTIMMSPILNLQGGRYRDACHWDFPGVGDVWVQREPWCPDGRETKGGPHLPPYSDLDQRFCYINGGYFCTKKSFIDKVRWNPTLQWGQAEDVEISLRMRWEPDFDYKFNPYSIVQLQKQKDRILPIYPHEHFASYQYAIKGYDDLLECKEKINFYIGDKYYKLFISDIFTKNNNKKLFAKCICDCGKEKIIPISEIRNGNNKSCGCGKDNAIVQTSKTHGLSGVNREIYNKWKLMKSRCYNVNNASYKDYGFRGITVCDEWKYNFENFYKWALDNNWSTGLTIERKNVNDSYNPENCCFIKPQEQSRNRRTNRMITAFGETKIISDWSRDPRCNVTYKCLLLRLNKGWEPESAIVTGNRLNITAFSETKSIIEWSVDDRCRVSEKILRERLLKGWDAERAISSPLRKQKGNS